MASLIARFRRPRQAEDSETPEMVETPPAPPPRRLPLPPPGRLRRERRALLRWREQRLNELGVLVLDMYREDQFRQDIVYEHAAESRTPTSLRPAASACLAVRTAFARVALVGSDWRTTV